MSTAFRDLFNELGSPLLFEQLGEDEMAVTHYPQNVPANATPRTVIFNEIPANEDLQAGKKNERHATLLILDTITLDARDTWLINAEFWKTRSWNTTSAGLLQAQLYHEDPNVQSKRERTGIPI